MSNKLSQKKYKALICDVDGTLIPLEKDAMPSDAVIEALDKASQRIHVGIATSRPLEALAGILSKVHLSGPSVINGGSIIIDGSSHKILWEKTIDEDSYHKTIDIIKKYVDSFIINEEGLDIPYTPTLRPKKVIGIWVPNIDYSLAELLVEEISKISTVAIHKVIIWEKDKIGVEVTHAEATKQHGIFEVAKLLNIETKDIIGVGDGYNDFPLLMACGLKVAMGNAVEDIKAIADYIAPTVEEDGVADVINKFVLS